MEMISVIIPSYNRGSTIKRAIQSVLDQTYRNIEVIIVDDGSTDNTEEIVSGLKNDKVFYYKNTRNIGACGSRNRGITLAKGEFIAFQDSDDEWLPEKLKKQMDFFSKVNCDLVFCSMDRISDKKKEVYPPYLPDNNSSLFKQLLHENCTSTQTLLGKRKVFENIQFDESMPRFQDWEIMLRISLVYSVKHLNEILVKSYIQNDSISLNSKSAISGLKKIYEIHKEAILADEKINGEFCIKIAEYMLANGENPKEHYKKAFQLNFSIKLFLFYLICSVSLHKFLFKVKQFYFWFR
jgi:glycosyltransferase involved in cell wall biosynthesis